MQQAPTQQAPTQKEGSDSSEPTAKPLTSSTPATAAPEEAETPESPAPKQTEAAPVAPVQKPAVSKPSPTIPSNSFDDRLTADGERYLYGRGVPEDCARAQRNLQIGARNSNPKAQTLLGAMYATGHCVNRDLPTAYRWFAKALHGDPGNSRVQRDLEVLWKQMTPEERQLAMKSQ
jgi:TPR repeat protein